jgi:hypothetical protein
MMPVRRMPGRDGIMKARARFESISARPRSPRGYDKSSGYSSIAGKRACVDPIAGLLATGFSGAGCRK